MMSTASDFDMEPLVCSLHSLVDKNNEMQDELMQFHRDKSGLIPEIHDDAIPKDSVALNRYKNYHFTNSCDDDSYSCDGDSTAAESSSWTSSCSSSCMEVDRPRRVRFNVFVEHSHAPEQLDEEDCASLWYNSEDFRYFKKYSKKLASIAKASSYRTELSSILDVCAGATNQDVTHCSRIANTAVRGLEVVVASDVMSRDRANAIRGVLRAHSEGASADHLSETSKALTRSARLFARILGNGDAAIAKAISR
eukprot:CAMPEP_0198150052 /NCGR_PEP_ID=MMETSP1443-20131203/49166_1 /TAXON_ID=186043 /ORGANISM="Entomoneis sp., Strain CCMP2396" /LENGTH=251 /DNA_ID=CAMNT_0043815245 /DNA_START=61 /DNA_END=816 /DNA_ORIENTATION=-